MVDLTLGALCCGACVPLLLLGVLALWGNGVRMTGSGR